MNAYRRHFALVFFSGAIALAGAIAYSSITTGLLFFPHSFLIALGAFGLGNMAAGFTLWISLCRQLGGKPTLNTLFDFLIVSGSLLLFINLFVAGRPYSPMLTWAGLGLVGSALVIGLLAMLIDPAYPCAIATRWPEGGEKHPNPYVPALELRRPGGYAVAPQDLTVIEGIGPRIQEILNQVGIINYKDLIYRDPEELRELLAEYHVTAPVDPSTWPEQARLAEQGDWEALRALKERLVAGQMRA